MSARWIHRAEVDRRTVSLLAFLLFMLVLTQPSGSDPQVEMTGFRITQETGSGQWEIRAGRAYYSGEEVVLQDVTARMLASGVEQVRVTSETGRYESRKMLLHLEGRVDVVSSLGSRFSAPRLSWDGPSGIMTAGSGITLQRGGWKILGERLSYRVDPGMALVQGKVRTTWENDGKTP